LDAPAQTLMPRRKMKGPRFEIAAWARVLPSLAALPVTFVDRPAGTAIHGCRQGAHHDVDANIASLSTERRDSRAAYLHFHSLYALDAVLPDLKVPAKAALEKAMQGYV
jgi:hypothetical protein